MRACLVFLCLLATALPLTVTSKPHGKHHGLHKALQTAKEKDLITEETNKPQILPTVITFEASSQEQEDEELSSQDNANKEEEKSTEKRGKSTAVLLSEEELVDLLQGEEEEEDAEREQEEEGREGEDAGKEVTEDDKTEAEEKLDESSETDEEVMEEAEEERAVEDVIEEEVEKISSEERMEEPAGKDEQVTPFEDMDGSAESEIPVNLDYAADSGILQPLHKTHTETLKSTPEIGISETEEKKSNEKQPADMDSDHEQNMQQTEAADSEEVLDQNKDKEQPNKQAELNVKKKEPETNVDPQEPKSNAELESKSRPSGKEEEKSKNESGSHTKGKGKKQKKNQRARKHSVQRDEAQQGVIQSQQDAPQSDGSSTDNTVHKAKRRRAGKWGPLVGVNPVQIRATVELFPRSRPSLGGGAHLSEAPADPCDNFRCKRGKTCKLDEDNKPGCVCQQPSECPPSVNEFDHVCGTDNKTYDTSCELFATKCNLEGTKKGHRLHLDYTGSCKVIPSCEDSELVQFPLRMRDWLKNVLLQLYEHDVVTPGFLTPKQHFRVKKIFESERRLHAGDHSVELLAQDFEKNYNMYIYPVHWQFAQLDQHPSDRLGFKLEPFLVYKNRVKPKKGFINPIWFLSHSELAPLRVPLVPMEHCTSRFFQECDADKDKQVSFKEWTSCFGIKNEDMDANLLF